MNGEAGLESTERNEECRRNTRKNEKRASNSKYQTQTNKIKNMEKKKGKKKKRENCDRLTC